MSELTGISRRDAETILYHQLGVVRPMKSLLCYFFVIEEVGNRTNRYYSRFTSDELLVIGKKSEIKNASEQYHLEDFCLKKSEIKNAAFGKLNFVINKLKKRDY